MTHKIIIFILFGFSSLHLNAQNFEIIDSLKKLLDKSTDTNYVIISYEISEIYSDYGDSTALLFAYEGLNKARLIKYDKGIYRGYGKIFEYYYYTSQLNNCLIYLDSAYQIASNKIGEDAASDILNNKALILVNLGNYKEALRLYLKSLEIRERLQTNEKSAQTLTNLGVLFQSIGDYPEALRYYHNAYNKYSSINDEEGKMNILNNMGVVYYNLQENDEAIMRYREALTIAEKLKKQRVQSILLNNIGNCYADKKDADSALAYYERSLDIKKMFNDKIGEADLLLNIGIIFLDIKNISKAELFINKALKIFKEVNDPLGEANSLCCLAKAHMERKNYSLSGKLFNQSLNISLSVGAKSLIRSVAKGLYELNKISGNYKKALEYHVMYFSYSDSIMNENKSREFGSLEGKFQLQREIEERKRQEEEEARIIEEERKRTSEIQYLIIFTIVISAFVLIFIVKKKNINPRLMEGLVFFSFLLLIEAVTTFLDPYVEDYSKGFPLPKLAINMILAVGLTMIDVYFEKKLKINGNK